ncbi:hypothetical protein QQS21_012255 [Conoideocrella luteorostrata]|uniref:Uncharacterized protein n=1 Tax=Conoideocrella luteorostrata TaxID=1105319 RepID=A0AAJ0FMU1_9HYPO|nr:hypothetical protein QQS21_012255 [Conoideocrella luteorostrata]
MGGGRPRLEIRHPPDRGVRGTKETTASRQAGRRGRREGLEPVLTSDERPGSALEALTVVREIQRLLVLLKEEGISGTSGARAYYDAFQVAIMHSDTAHAREFANRAFFAQNIVEGLDSPEVQRLNKLAADPTQHASYGLSKMWKTAFDNSPIYSTRNISITSFGEDKPMLLFCS